MPYLEHSQAHIRCPVNKSLLNEWIKEWVDQISCRLLSIHSTLWNVLFYPHNHLTRHSFLLSQSQSRLTPEDLRAYWGWKREVPPCPNWPIMMCSSSCPLLPCSLSPFPALTLPLSLPFFLSFPPSLLESSKKSFKGLEFSNFNAKMCVDVGSGGSPQL